MKAEVERYQLVRVGRLTRGQRKARISPVTPPRHTNSSLGFLKLQQGQTTSAPPDLHSSLFPSTLLINRSNLEIKLSQLVSHYMLLCEGKFKDFVGFFVAKMFSIMVP